MVINQFNEIIMDFQPAVYEGHWKLNKRSGFGKMSWPDNTSFEGTWYNDQRVEGKFIMADQNVYEGQFKNDKFHGVGQIHYARDLITIEGIFSNGLASKTGKIIDTKSNYTYIGGIEELKK